MKRIVALAMCAASLGAAAQLPDYVPTEGLVAWFDFGLGQEDQSGNLELILHGGAQLADGVLDVSQSGAWAESNELPPSLEGAPAFSVVAVLQSQMSHYNAASWGIGGGSTTQNINSWNHSSGEAANQVTVDLWGETTFGSGLEYSQEEFDVALWTKTAGNFSAGNILLGLNDQIVGGPDLAALRNGLDLPDLPEGGKLYLGKAGLEDNYYGPFKIKIFGLFDRALDVEEYLLLRFNMIEELGGCTDISACNYSPEALVDDGSCESFGCMDSNACNFSAEAACDDGSCDYSCCPGPGCCLDGQHWDWELNGCVITNPSDSNFDGCVQLNDLLDLLSAYGDCGSEESPWQCGDPREYQGYDYETVQIGEQCWFAENVRYLPAVSPVLLGSEDDGMPHAYVYGYDGANTSEAVLEPNYQTYGGLYNYQAVQAWGLCPTGWSIPNQIEWDILTTNNSVVDCASNSWFGSNVTGLDLLPGGDRDGVQGANAFNNLGSSSLIWLEGDNPESPVEVGVHNESWYIYGIQSTSFGFSVRCIKDAE